MIKRVVMVGVRVRVIVESPEQAQAVATFYRGMSEDVVQDTTPFRVLCETQIVPGTAIVPGVEEEVRAPKEASPLSRSN